MRKILLALIGILGLGLLILAWCLLTASCTDDEIPCTDAGPQSPRDIAPLTRGTNPVTFARALPFEQMQLCDIHFHRFAEHKAAGYPTLAGEGDHRGYVCKGRPPPEPGGRERESGGDCKGVQLGDTVEVHWVFTTCDVEPAPTLDSCFSDICVNPQLRAEAKVFVLTAGEDGELDFAAFSDETNVVLPPAEGAVEYLGSTTGPDYNNDTSCSPFQVTFNVRPDCSTLSLASLEKWCRGNVFEEDHAHGVRALVTPLKLQSRVDPPDRPGG